MIVDRSRVLTDAISGLIPFPVVVMVVFKNTSVVWFFYSRQKCGCERDAERLFLSLGDLLHSLLLGRLSEEDRVNVRKDTALGDGDRAEKFVELLVVADSKLDVSWDDTSLLVIAGSVTGKLKDLSSEVLKDGSKVDRGASTDTGGVLALLEEAADTADRELKTSLGRFRSGLLSSGGLSTSSLSSFSSSSSDRWHFDS